MCMSSLMITDSVTLHVRHFLRGGAASLLAPAILWGATTLLARTHALAAEPPVPAKVTFNRDVRPILSSKCFYCHGFDPKNRKADRRIDTAEGAMAELDGVRAVVPGDLKQSAVWTRIASNDQKELMPPLKSHKTLDAREKETIKRWIEQGAQYEKHWSFEVPHRAALPAVKDKRWVRNPIDAFVLAGLEQAGLKPAAEADRRTLARRLSLDLTGLPPKPEEVEAFVADASPEAYEKLAARLMDSQQWGEHRGRYWLDAARYGDTHGIHIDNYREIWPYRDWVINAFNRNMRFDAFTVEQIAGDLLPNPTREQLVATGFHRCNITTGEGGAIGEEYLAIYANDRVTTTSWVWLGLTANCAACHDHKFDPITQKDFYSMAAYFRNTTQEAMDRNAKDVKPVVYLPAPADEKRFDELPKLIAAASAEVTKRRTEAAKTYDEWVAQVVPQQLRISSKDLVLSLPLSEGKGETLGGQGGGKDISFTVAGPIQWRNGGKFGPAPAFTKDSHLDLGNLGDFAQSQAFSVTAWVKVPAGAKDGSIVARMDDRAGLQGWELFVQGKKFGLRLAAKDPVAELTVTSRRDGVVAGKWQHVLATYDGKGAAAGLKLYVDGKEPEVDRKGGALKGRLNSTASLRIGRRETKGFLAAAELQDVRVYARALNNHDVLSVFEEPNLRAIAALAPGKRNAAQKTALMDFYFRSVDTTSMEIAARLDGLTLEDATIRARTTVSHIQEEKPGEAMANILMRGAYDKLGEKVTPAGFSALHAMPANAPKNRLGLARWLMASENPLTARVTVNRFWQELFGTGLVKTVEDFGTQGERPANQALLDWLAVEFRESGWDVKKLFTLMVSSATYRQMSKVAPDKLEQDPQNRMLSRGPRFRMDAEMIRDYALAVSSSLSPKMGGPGTKPYQPDNIWEIVGLQGSRYKQDTGENLYRRTIYNFWKRQSPPPNMEVFNAPTREVCTVRRERTNTPLQALVTLNDPQFVEAARRLAQLVLKDNAVPAAAIAALGERVLLRPLSSAETQVVAQTEVDLEAEFAAHPERVKSFLSIGESKADGTLPAPRLAAFTMIASQLLNLDETLNK